MEPEVEELYKKHIFIAQKIRSVRSLKSLIHWYRKLFDVEKRLWELRTFSDYFLKTCFPYQWTKYTYDKDEIKRMCEEAST